MPSKDRLILYCDRIVTFCLYTAIFYLSFSIAGFEISIWTGIGFWTFKRLLGYRTDGLFGLIPETKLNKALIVFFLINAASVVFSMHLNPSVRGLFGKELKFLLIIFMITEAISKEKRLRNLIYVIIFSSSLMALDTIVQAVRGQDFLRNNHWMCATASFGSPGDLGGWLIVIIPLLCGLLMSRSKAWLFWSIKIFLAALIPILLGCLLLTYSRGAWVAFLIGCSMAGIYLIWKMSVKTKIYALIVAVIIFMVLAINFSQFKSAISSIGSHTFKSGEMLKDRVTVMGYSWDVRILLWKEALRVIRDHPILGTGLNTYALAIVPYSTFYFGGAYAHNSFLQMAAETGILGLLSFLWILFEYFKNGFQYLRRSRDFLVLGLMSGVLAFLAQSFVDTNLQALQLAGLFWYMIGLTLAVININGLDQKQEGL